MGKLLDSGQFLWTACITPFDDSHNVDLIGLETCLRRQESAGNGILVLGSTGENLSLTNAERMKIIEYVCSLNLRVQIIAGSTSHNLFETLEWIRFCNDMPIDGCLLATPIYTKPGVYGQTTWFENLLNLTVHPAILYNIPGRSGVNLYPETIRNLKGHSKLQAIKDSSGSTNAIIEYKNEDPDLAIFCGDDYMFKDFSSEGSIGLISVASNPWPCEAREFVRRVLCNENVDSKLWWLASKSLFSASNPIPVKALMKHMGIIGSDSVRTPLSVCDMPSLEPILQHCDAMRQWYSGTVSN